MFTVRVTGRSARARLDGDLHANLDEDRLLESVVKPFREGLAIAIGGRRVPADDISSVKITRFGDPLEDVTDHFIGAPQRAAERQQVVEDGEEEEKEDGVEEIPSWLTALLGTLTFAGVVITIAAAPKWLAAAAIAAALSVCALHRLVWRPRPSAWGALVVTIITGVVVVAAHFVLELGPGQKPRRDAAVEIAPEPRSVGQIGAGNIARASLNGASGTYSDPLAASAGSIVTAAVRLSNVGPDKMVGTRVSAELPSGAASALSIELIARPRNANPSSVADTVTLEVEGGEAACVAYVLGSTRLYNQHFGLIRELPDGITDAGVAIGPLGVPIEDTRFVGLEVRLEEPQADSDAGECS